MPYERTSDTDPGDDIKPRSSREKGGRSASQTRIIEFAILFCRGVVVVVVVAAAAGKRMDDWALCLACLRKVMLISGGFRCDVSTMLPECVIRIAAPPGLLVR